MKRGLAVVAVFLLTACNSHTDNATPTPSQPTVVPLPVAQASKAALTVADLPKGWEGGVAPDPTPTLTNPVTYDPEDCWMVRDPMRDLGVPATAIRGQYYLRVGDNSISVTEFIYSWPTPRPPVVQRIAANVTRCATITGTVDGETYQISARQLPVPGLKDGIVTRSGDAKSAGYAAYVARGGTLLKLTADSDTFPTDAAFVQFLKTAVARLDAVS
ncbi:hypothetical protein [Kribbella soli]|uniref:DUF5642 domain-containing protein n=1 Tax=Kribbella soli TaxID=1124743 RepID=A0A4R0HG71_9ACTN|nr:hypothetical protein [Kribbella soli]TCC08674.1 hypothetical protein E0H45_22755 [Kribbella soli]